MTFACIRCFAAYPCWVVCLFAGQCLECRARLEEICAEPEGVLSRER